MKKIYKILSMMLIYIIAFSGCSINSGEKSKELIVWCHLSDTEIIAVRKLADQWSKESGIRVKVHSDRGDNRALLAAYEDNMGPDIEFGIPHNRLQKLQSNNLLCEVPEGVIDKSKYISSSIEATTFANKMYGVPLSFETYALYYNKDKVNDAPQTLEELISQGQKLGFQYDINNFYLSFPFLKVNGAYIFKKDNGSYDIHSTGLNTLGAVKGYSIIQDMVQKYKLMPANIDSVQARKNFEEGKIAYYISGSWDLEEFKKFDINYSVAPLPKYNNNQMSTFVTTQVAFVSSKSKKQKEAWDLMKYLLSKTPETLYVANGRIPALNLENSIKEVIENDKIKVFIKQAESGDTLPNVAEIGGLQDSGKIISQLTSGKISPSECGVILEKAIKDYIEKEKQKIN